jgi:hypothetical protein
MNIFQAILFSLECVLLLGLLITCGIFLFNLGRLIEKVEGYTVRAKVDLDNITGYKIVILAHIVAIIILIILICTTNG